jgi:hypothetical protein
MRMLKSLFKKFINYCNKPMTQQDYDTMMARAGFKKCPHCGKYLSNN